MNRNMSKRLISWIILITFISVTLSSCSFIDQFTDKGKIKISVNSYLSDIQSGVFVFDNLESQYASDKAFSEMKYLVDESEVIMKAGMKKITFEIGDITADKSSKSGTCVVTISAIDVPKVIEGFVDHNPDFDELLEAVKAQNPVMSSHTITLSVVYDSAGKMWKVKDSLPLVDIIAKPYTELTFYPDPTETVNLLIAAVNANDYLELEERSADLSWSMPEDDFDKRIQEAFNSVIVFEILEEPIIKGNIAQVKIKFTFPDFKSLIEDLMVDVEFWALYLKPILLGAIEGKEYEELQLVSDQILSDEFIARIKNPSAKSVAEETLMELEFDEETESWLLSSWNYESMMDFSDIEEPEMPEDMLIQAGTRALEMLYADGEISKSEYNSLLKGLQE